MGCLLEINVLKVLHSGGAHYHLWPADDRLLARSLRSHEEVARTDWDQSRVGQAVDPQFNVVELNVVLILVSREQVASAQLVSNRVQGEHLLCNVEWHDVVFLDHLQDRL